MTRPPDATAREKAPPRYLFTRGSLKAARPWIVVGFVGACIAVAAGSYDRPGPGRSLLGERFTFGDASGVVRDAGLGVASVICMAGIGVLSLAWVRLAAAWRATDDRPTPGHTLGIIGVWALPFALGPALFSADIFSYAAQGQIVAAGLDPYRSTAADLPATSPVIDLVAPIWRDTPSPYGPLWSRLSGWAAHVGGDDPFRTVTMLRLLALASVIVIAWAAVTLAQDSRRPAFVVLITVGNPLVLMHLISGGHNEAPMLAVLLVAFVLARRSAWVPALMLAGVATAIKAPAAVGAVALGWAMFAKADSPPSWRQRGLGLATAGAIGGGTLALVTWITGLGWGWISTLTTPGPSRAITAPVRGLGFAVAQLTGPFGHLTTRAEVVAVTGPIGVALTVGAVGAVLWWRRDSTVIELTGWLALAAVLFGPSLYPWYLIAPVVCVGLTPSDRRDTYDAWRWRMIAVVSISLSAAQLPSGASVIYLLGAVGPWASALLWGTLVGYGVATHPERRELSKHATI